MSDVKLKIRKLVDEFRTCCEVMASEANNLADSFGKTIDEIKIKEEEDSFDYVSELRDLLELKDTRIKELQKTVTDLSWRLEH